MKPKKFVGKPNQWTAVKLEVKNNMRLLLPIVHLIVFILCAGCASKSTPLGDLRSLEALLAPKKWFIANLDDRLDDYVSITMTLIAKTTRARICPKQEDRHIQLFVTSKNPQFIYCKSEKQNSTEVSWVKYHMEAGDEMHRIVGYLSRMPSRHLTSYEQKLAIKFIDTIKNCGRKQQNGERVQKINN